MNSKGENSTRKKYVPPHLRSSQGGGRGGKALNCCHGEKRAGGSSENHTQVARVPQGSVEDTEEVPQYLYIIRHGDRWDEENPSWKTTSSRPLDPPLSQLGHNQARETGLFLDKLFEKDGITSAEDTTWLSSPFLRCLQTSDEALNALTLPRAHRIRILPEYCVSEWGDRRSLPPLQERQLYFPRLEASYESMFDPSPSENPRVFWERCARAALSVSERLPYRPNTAVVVVSHAAPCIGIAEAAADLTWAEVNPAAPCGIYRLCRTGAQQDSWTIDMNGHTNHLSDVSGSTGAWHPLENKKKKKKKYCSSSVSPECKFASPKVGWKCQKVPQSSPGRPGISTQRRSQQESQREIFGSMTGNGSK